MSDFLVDRGETKRIFVDLVGLVTGEPEDPPTPPQISIKYPTTTGIVDADMENDALLVGRWFYDWETDAITDRDGKYPIRVEANLNDFKSIDSFTAYLFSEDIVDQLIDSLAIEPDMFLLEDYEDLRVEIARQVNRAYQKILEIPNFTFDWTNQDHFDAVQCRSEVYVLRRMLRMMLSGAIGQDFTIGDFRMSGSGAKAPADQVRTALNSIQDDCKLLWAKLSAPEYQRMKFVKYPPSNPVVSDPWNAHFRGPANSV